MLNWFPSPQDAGEQARWDESGRRWRLLEGQWKPDALDREATFFAPEVRMFLPDPELSRNPFASITRQVSCLYDRDWTIGTTPEAAEDQLEKVVTPELLPLCQRRLVYTVGLGECLMRMDVEQGADGMRYRVVSPHRVECRASRSDPTVPISVREYRPRWNPQTEEDEWTVETWDTENPASPVFRIEAINQQNQKRIDVTSIYAPEWVGRYPHVDAAGPILPYTLWHAEIGSGLWNPTRWMEIVEGTLTTSVLWTFWLSGVRDGAHPQRWALNADPRMATTKVSGVSAVVEWIKSNPLTIMLFRSKPGESAQMGQFQPAMDPKSCGESIEHFESGLALYAGISPADLQRSQSGMSGYSIVVSREGLRTAKRRFETPTRLGDRRFFATASRLSNLYLGTRLPTEPAGWDVRYAEIGRSQEEVVAEVDTVSKLLDLGQISPVDAQRRLNPGMTEDEAVRKLAEIAEIKRTLAAASTPPQLRPFAGQAPVKPGASDQVCPKCGAPLEYDDARDAWTCPKCGWTGPNAAA